MSEKDTISKISKIILNELDNIEKNQEKRTPTTSNVFATTVSKFGSDFDPRKELSSLQNELIIQQVKLLEKPFNAYVRARINDKTEKTYFVCRGYTPHNIRPLTPNSEFLNYKSPMGRLVEIDVGDEEDFYIGTGEIFAKVIEKDYFTPQKEKNVWDAINNSIYIESGIYSVESLLTYLRLIGLSADQIEALELEDRLKYEKSINIRKGLLRKVIEKMELRDQPILDKYQGEIFRIPISSKLIITGAPGTGKTTLLIKRISQKSDAENLDSSELQSLNKDQINQFFHNKNWILFTPTELLKIFLKEAFSKESLPASNELVKVWDDERTIIGRQILNFLKTGDRGYFIINDKKILLSSNNYYLLDLLNEFLNFYYDTLYNKINNLKVISKVFFINPNLKNILSLLFSNLSSFKDSDYKGKVFFSVEYLAIHRNLVLELSSYISNCFENTANYLINKNPALISNIISLLANDDTSEQDSQSDYEEDELTEIEQEPPTNQKPVIAKRQLKKTLRAYSLNLAQKRTFSKNSINFLIFNEIKDDLEKSEAFAEVGEQIIEIRILNELTFGHRLLLNSIPRYYQQFRNFSISKNSNFFNTELTDLIKAKYINRHEADLICFVILRHSNIIFKKNPELLENNSRNDLLENIKSNFRTIVAIDEATDFSTLQIGSMSYFAHPRFSSVSIAGDLMQRVTSHGIKKWDDLQIIDTKFDLKKVDKVYRQSAKLLEIAKVLYKNSIGEEPPFESGYEKSDSDPNPLIYYSKNNDINLSKWISNRIIEINKINNYSLPSVAIFVADDNSIEYAVNILKNPLEENSIGVKGCHKGEILGSEGKVRIFSVQYIKGLEFESVFFINIEDIFENNKHVFDKFLYVGLTRAASFLAITCRETFPQSINYIKSYFKEEKWIY